MTTEAKSTDIGTERIDKKKLKSLILGSEPNSTKRSVLASSILGAEPSPTERAVPVKDVMVCVKSNCNHCLGRGVLTITSPGQVKAHGLVCRCAVKRFLVKNKGLVVMDKAGNFFYKV
jgi:hypothetical protein